jgi:uncharacterized repeat protein (TIGR01451 family)
LTWFEFVNLRLSLNGEAPKLVSLDIFETTGIGGSSDPYVRKLFQPAIIGRDLVVDNDQNACGAEVDLLAAISGHGGTVSFETAAGKIGPRAFFPLGTTKVTATTLAKATATFSVTVRDAQRPVITCPADIEALSDPGQTYATLNPSTPAVYDNCPGATVAGQRSDGQPLTAPYPVGTTTITWTARDAAGNAASAPCQQRITVRTQADLQVIKYVMPGSATKVGGFLTYQIEVHNLGPSPALGVTLSDPLSPSMALVGVTSSGSCSGNPNVQCSLGTINPGAVGVIKLMVKPLSPGLLLNTASAAANPALTTDPNASNNSSTASQTIASR